MLRILQTKFSCDIGKHIFDILACLKIQRRVKLYFFRHTRHPEWSLLRRRLLYLTRDQINTLTRCALVRSEWRTEPESWIYMLDHNVYAAEIIAKEIQEGAWRISV